MKHVNPDVFKPWSLIHFIYGSPDRALCGAVIPITGEFTTDQVNCSKCIRTVEQCKNVKETEYIKP
ncbi:MAG: hypothetical protein Q8L89_04275 [Gammaproteobacteria bacterium]|nr:hypothetical protein [Gammaproteobacteria bacterium]